MGKAPARRVVREGERVPLEVEVEEGEMEGREVVGRLVQAAAPIDRQHTEPPRQMPVSITTFHPTRLMKPSM